MVTTVCSCYQPVCLSWQLPEAKERSPPFNNTQKPASPGKELWGPTVCPACFRDSVCSSQDPTVDSGQVSMFWGHPLSSTFQTLQWTLLIGTRKPMIFLLLGLKSHIIIAIIVLEPPCPDFCFRPREIDPGSVILLLLTVVQSLSPVWLFATSWTAARQDSLSFTISWSLLKLMFIELVMPSNHLILYHPCLLPTIFPSIRIFSNELALPIRWPKYWSFSFSISPSNEYLGLISFRIDRFDLLAVQGTLKSLLQHHSSKALILQHSAFFMV